jgi:hypothetical protein
MLLLRNWNLCLLGCLVLVTFLAFSVVDDPSLMSAAVLEAIEENARTVVESTSAAAGTATAAAAGSLRGSASVGDTDADTNADADADTSITDTTDADAATSSTDVHKVAGLSCAQYGGPPDEIAAEMVYWRDIPQDAAYVSTFRDYGPEKKYLTFEPDEGMRDMFVLKCACNLFFLLPLSPYTSHVFIALVQAAGIISE